MHRYKQISTIKQNAKKMMSIMPQTLFYNLPSDILKHIYDYDDTYRNIFKNQVKLALWREAWYFWKFGQDYKVAFVMEYLFLSWGIDDTPSMFNICDLS